MTERNGTPCSIEGPKGEIGEPGIPGPLGPVCTGARGPEPLSTSYNCVLCERWAGAFTGSIEIMPCVFIHLVCIPKPYCRCSCKCDLRVGLDDRNICRPCQLSYHADKLGGKLPSPGGNV